jgi:hypothetical protein
MASKPRNNSVRVSAAPVAAFLASSMEAQRITTLTMGAASNPEALDKCQERARYWSENNWLVRSILMLRQCFYDFEFKLTAVSDKDADAVERWASAHAATMAAYRRDAWKEWGMVDVVVGLWRKGGRPLVFPVEKCRYSDTFGMEQLTIRHGLSDAAIDALDLSPAEKVALKNSSELKLGKDHPLFKFEVLKRASIGNGFGFPGMKTLFTALAQNESMEVGDNLLAGVGRDVIVQQDSFYHGCEGEESH